MLAPGTGSKLEVPGIEPGTYCQVLENGIFLPNDYVMEGGCQRHFVWSGFRECEFQVGENTFYCVPRSG